MFFPFRNLVTYLNDIKLSELNRRICKSQKYLKKEKLKRYLITHFHRFSYPQESFVLQTITKLHFAVASYKKTKK